MKYLFLIISCFFLISCSNNKSVYWCGDHACINKKEKEAYFKKTMIVEKRVLNKNDKKSKSEIERLKKRIGLEQKEDVKNEKKQAKAVRLEEKRRLKEEKEKAKEAIRKEKRRLKEEKKLAKQIDKNEKKKYKENKKLIKKNKTKEKDMIKSNILLTDVAEFEKVVETIIKRNESKGFPDINNIPN